jgi:hypothetical protein
LYLEGSYVSLQQWPDQLGGLIEYLMQQETILRKCKAVLDLSSVYEKMVQLCSKEDSRPPLAPAFIVKYLLVSFLYSQPSNRAAHPFTSKLTKLMNCTLPPAFSTSITTATWTFSAASLSFLRQARLFSQ